MTDLVIISPGAAHGIAGGHAIYGDLGATLVAKEPPLWCRLIAGYVRDRGLSVAIIDAEAEDFSPRDVVLTLENMAEKPRLICIAVYGHQPSASTQQMDGASAIARELSKEEFGIGEIPTIMVGGHVAALPVRTLEEEAIDYACNGEGPATVAGLLEPGSHEWEEDIPGLVWRDAVGKTIVNKPAPLIPIDELHGNAWDLLPMHLYRAHNWQCFDDLSKRQPYASIYTSLGCPYRCLAGDTPVETVYGPIPIAELVERFPEGVPVYTYDRRCERAKVSLATNIRRYGQGEPLVRVRFDDGSHIDCTPDHKLLVFKWGNQHVDETEWPVEAQYLKAGMSVRALKASVGGPKGDQYVTMSWKRRGREKAHRMVAEYTIGRPVLPEEHAHHIDGDRLNNRPENLCVVSPKMHGALHPEIAERMRTNNPTKNGMSAEWIAKIAAAGRGKVRSDASRERYRLAALKREAARREARAQPVNHKVVAVEPLPGGHDVYCLTVDTGWFYANKVLVKNCSFCCIQAPFSPEVNGNRYRMRDPEDVVREIADLWNDHGVKTIKIIDEMFVLNERHYTAICGYLIQGKKDGHIPDDLNIWAYARVDTVKPHTLEMFREAGIRWLALGIESGSKHVRDGAEKALRSDDIVGVVSAIRAAGINVIGNYIFGLPDDDTVSMQETLDLALALNTEFANFYSAMAYPGSALYTQALTAGKTLPSTWRSYSQHNADSRPLDTEHVSAKEVLAFRDRAFDTYFTNPAYLAMAERKFGAATLAHVREMTTYKLHRKLLTGEIS